VLPRRQVYRQPAGAGHGISLGGDAVHLRLPARPPGEGERHRSVAGHRELPGLAIGAAIEERRRHRHAAIGDGLRRVHTIYDRLGEIQARFHVAREILIADRRADVAGERLVEQQIVPSHIIGGDEQTFRAERAERGQRQANNQEGRDCVLRNSYCVIRNSYCVLRET